MRSASEGSSACEGVPEGNLVGELNIAADWHAEGEAADGNPSRFEQARQIERGRFSFDVRICGENYFFDAIEPGEKAIDRELIGSDTALG